jgi:hypothetical protein
MRRHFKGFAAAFKLVVTPGATVITPAYAATLHTRTEPGTHLCVGASDLTNDTVINK